MHVPVPPSTLGNGVGSIELTLPPRAAPQCGEMDQDQDGDGLLSMDGRAIRPALLPLLDGLFGPRRGEDIAPPGSSPDFVCGLHSHIERPSTIRFNEPRDSSPDKQRSRLNRKQKEVPINLRN